MDQGDLIKLETLKDALSIPYSDKTRDVRLEQAIKNASSAIRSYTDRDFGTLTETATRTFAYDGSGILEIDDCTTGSITAITIAGAALSASEYIAQPDRRSPVQYWLMLNQANTFNREMNFSRNLNDYGAYTMTMGNIQVTVTATRGWPAVPDDVQQSAVYTAAAMAESPKPYIAQNFENYSVQMATPMNDAIPARAKALLDPYQRLRL